jgi:hypothetical protein
LSTSSPPCRSYDGWDEYHQTSQKRRCRYLFSPPKKQTTVISTEAAHSIIVSSGVEKSASPPQPLCIAHRAFAVQPQNALTFCLSVIPQESSCDLIFFVALTSFFHDFSPKIACQVPKPPNPIKINNIRGEG